MDSDKTKCESQPAKAPPSPLPPPRASPSQLFESSAISVLPLEPASDAVPHSVSEGEVIIPPERPVRRRKKPSAFDKSTEEVTSSVVMKKTKELPATAVSSSSSLVLEPTQMNVNHKPQQNDASSSEEGDPDIVESQK